MHRIVCDDCGTPCPVGAIAPEDAIQMAKLLGWQRITYRPVGAYMVPVRQPRDRCPGCRQGKPERQPSPAARCPQCRGTRPA